MKTLRRKIAWLFLTLFLVSGTGLAFGSELATRYLYGGITYPTLQGAEQALRNDYFIGSAYYTYQYSVQNGAVRKYDHPPTTGYFEGPKLAFTSIPGAPCDDSPLFDPFGNDRCSNVRAGRCCGSEEKLWTAIQDKWPDVDCPLVKTGETAWERVGFGTIGYPMKMPEEYLMLQGLHNKSVYFEFPPGDAPVCGSSHEYFLAAYSPGHCPGGYSGFSNLAGLGLACHVSVRPNIHVLGAKTAEPGPNSCSVGNPCHPATGDKTLSETDFSSPTLPFSRHYHSHQVYPDFTSMGKGWSHTYSGRILVEDSIFKMIDGKGNAERFRCADSPGCASYSSQSESGNILRPVAGGWDVFLKSGEIRQYDETGRLILITDRSGTFRQVAITYNARGQISEVIDQSGRALQFTYNANELVDAVTLPDGLQLRYDYAIPATDSTNNPHYNLVKVTREDLTERLYHYEDKDGLGADRFGNLLTGITDENGVRYATYAYDDAARVTSSEHAGGAGRIELDYTRRSGESFDWSITQVTLPLGEVVSYEMEAGPYRKLTDVEDTRGSVAMSYDSGTGWRTSKTDREGIRTSYLYDHLHETARVEAVGTSNERMIETDWNNALNRISERREPGKTTSYTFNSRGQVVTQTLRDTSTSETRRWTYTYYELPSPGPLIGQLQTVDGPRTDVGDITTYEYYTSDHPDGEYVIGDFKALVNALGHRTTYLKYDDSGRPLEIQDANNVVTVLTYHPRGWVQTRTTDGQTTTFSYDMAGNLIRVTQPDSSFSQHEYDDAHRLIALGDNFNNRVEYTLDAAGNRTTENTFDDHGVLRRRLSRVYDTLSRLTELLDGNNDPTRYGYDNKGNRASTLDPNLNTTRFEYDPLDRLAKTIDSILGETQMDYDDRDNLVSVSDPLGNVTQYHYDGLDNQTRLDSPDTGTSIFEYDDAGNRTAVTDARNVRTEFFYDALNRLTDVVHPESTLDISFTYDVGSNAKGRLAAMTDSQGNVSYSYDPRGNLLTETRSIGLNQYITSYAYSAADRLTRISYPSGMIIDYSLDAAGRISAVDKTVGAGTEAVASNVQYEPFGPVTTFTYGNGLTYSASFDQDFELDSLQSGSDLDWQLGHDAVGNILSIADQVDNTLDQNFTYDDLYRLESAQGSYSNEMFEYDANGNRTRLQTGVVDEPYTYEPQSSRLATQNGWTFTRDAAGNRTAKLDAGGLGQLYSFADHNRLSRTSVRQGQSDVTVGEYQYDGRGQRILKTTESTTLHFIYGPSGELLGEYQDDGSPLKEYIYLNGQPVAVFATDTVDIPSTPINLIIDNDDPETSSTGQWDLKKNKKDYAENYRLGDKADTYRWTPPPINGTFEVYAWWVSGKKNSKEANYTIQHNGASEVIVRGHNKNGGKWNLLGTFEFSGSGDEYVELHSGNGKKISADAIRFTQIAGGGGGGNETTTATYFVHTDHLGTPRRVSDISQSIVWRWDSRPFGDSTPNEDPDGNSQNFIFNFRFPGQYYDIESGLHYNYFRTYDPGTGRYIESDPIGLEGGLNTFAYVDSNSISFSDKLGLAYFSFRPLRGLHGEINCRKGIISDRLNTQLSHEQLFFEDGKEPSNLGLMSNSRVGPDKPENLDRYRSRCRSTSYNDCVMRKAVSITTGGSYCLIGINGLKNNCQDWASRVRANYRALLSNPSVREQCFDCEEK